MLVKKMLSLAKQKKKKKKKFAHPEHLFDNHEIFTSFVLKCQRDANEKTDMEKFFCKINFHSGVFTMTNSTTQLRLHADSDCMF